MDTERFLEEIGLYPFLYGKTMPDYKDKEAKMNRWDLIGSMFGLTGTQAMLKFKNIRDRWMKLVSGVEANTRSGAPGNNGKIKWLLFSTIDSMLRQTPHYAENRVPRCAGSHAYGLEEVVCSRSHVSAASRGTYADDTELPMKEEEAQKAAAPEAVVEACQAVVTSQRKMEESEHDTDENTYMGTSMHRRSTHVETQHKVEPVISPEMHTAETKLVKGHLI
ncbi:hypothetical protein HPB51_000661 [Rhipicephalus microplus]|uniref:MADF domain-containing protein n=1 Tax=Rhipicephalus microplus TaxID=6941 RepID=A0A9J6DRW9_RHIMP|nr:hypothetical protein HPB51_000661 [Rhipicephalus microplus]